MLVHSYMFPHLTLNLNQAGLVETEYIHREDARGKNLGI